MPLTKAIFQKHTQCVVGNTRLPVPVCDLWPSVNYRKAAGIPCGRTIFTSQHNRYGPVFQAGLKPTLRPSQERLVSFKYCRNCLIRAPDPILLTSTMAPLCTADCHHCTDSQSPHLQSLLPMENPCSEGEDPSFLDLPMSDRHPLPSEWPPPDSTALHRPSSRAMMPSVLKHPASLKRLLSFLIKLLYPLQLFPTFQILAQSQGMLRMCEVLVFNLQNNKI